MPLGPRMQISLLRYVTSPTPSSVWHAPFLGLLKASQSPKPRRGSRDERRTLVDVLGGKPSRLHRSRDKKRRSS